MVELEYRALETWERKAWYRSQKMLCSSKMCIVIWCFPTHGPWAPTASLSARLERLWLSWEKNPQATRAPVNCMWKSRIQSPPPPRPPVMVFHRCSNVKHTQSSHDINLKDCVLYFHYWTSSICSTWVLKGGRGSIVLILLMKSWGLLEKEQINWISIA